MQHRPERDRDGRPGSYQVMYMPDRHLFQHKGLIYTALPVYLKKKKVQDEQDTLEDEWSLRIAKKK